MLPGLSARLGVRLEDRVTDSTIGSKLALFIQPTETGRKQPLPGNFQSIQSQETSGRDQEEQGTESDGASKTKLGFVDFFVWRFGVDDFWAAFFRMFVLQCFKS